MKKIENIDYRKSVYGYKSGYKKCLTSEKKIIKWKHNVLTVFHEIVRSLKVLLTLTLSLKLGLTLEINFNTIL